LGLALALVAAILTVVGLVLGAFSVALWIGAYSAFMFYALAPYWRRGLDSAAPGSGTRALGTPAAPEPDRGQS
jgi:hypothetical protein